MVLTAEILNVAAFLGAAIATGVASVSAGIGEGQTAGEASFALMRQPKSGDGLLRTMLISQAVTETGAIFGLVVSLLLIFSGLNNPDAGWYRLGVLMAAGLAIGLGSVGPGFGSGYTGAQACKSIGRMPDQQNKITTTMLIGQALAQTDAIFALVVSLLLLYSTPITPADATVGHILIRIFGYLGAAFSIGIGTFGPGIGIGFVAGRATDMLGRFPNQSPTITRTMFLGAAVSESTAIYALVISFLLIFI
jgi:ATP synthase F0 subunit c